MVPPPQSTPPTSAPLSPPPAPHPEQGGASLSRDLADFLVELSIAMHKHAIYPPGHPLLDMAVDTVSRRIGGLLLERSALSIGIARKQLIIEGVATDSSHPLLQELAHKLHRHHLGALKFSQGLERRELAEALATLAVDASRTERPIGLETESLGDRWAHVRLFPLTYDRLELLDEAPDETPSEDRIQAGRAAQLWVGLARAAMAADPSDTSTAMEPVAVARAIEEHQREQAYDQVIVGYMLQIAGELKTTDGVEATALQRRISKLVGELNPETLKRLLDMSGDVKQRRRFVLDAAQGMTVDAVVELVRAAADAERQTISHSMVRMLTKLAQHAQQDTTARRTEADRSLREAVGRLVGQWSLDDPNPEAYRAVLESVSRAAPGTPIDVTETACEPERLLQIGLEAGVLGAQIRKAADRMVSEGHASQLLDLLDGAPPAGVAGEIWAYLIDRDLLRDVLSAVRVDYTLVERIVARTGMAAAAPLLDAAEAASETKARERLYDSLVSLGNGVGPLVARRLPGMHTQIQRELLALLGRLTAFPEGLDARAYVQHADAAVRREAVKLLLKHPPTRDETLTAALADSDERTVYLALNAALERCPRAAVSLARERVDRGELDPALRALAIRVAATVRTPDTLQWLLSRVVTRSKWMKRLRLQPQSPEVVAALNALTAGWKDDPSVREVLELAKKNA
jgi:hypothetical protein